MSRKISLEMAIKIWLRLFLIFLFVTVDWNVCKFITASQFFMIKSIQNKALEGCYIIHVCLFTQNLGRITNSHFSLSTDPPNVSPLSQSYVPYSYFFTPKTSRRDFVRWKIDCNHLLWIQPMNIQVNICINCINGFLIECHFGDFKHQWFIFNFQHVG